jgi:hypothetical protein
MSVGMELAKFCKERVSVTRSVVHADYAVALVAVPVRQQLRPPPYSRVHRNPVPETSFEEPEAILMLHHRRRSDLEERELMLSNSGLQAGHVPQGVPEDILRGIQRRYYFVISAK